MCGAHAPHATCAKDQLIVVNEQAAYGKADCMWQALTGARAQGHQLSQAHIDCLHEGRMPDAMQKSEWEARCPPSPRRIGLKRSWTSGGSRCKAKRSASRAKVGPAKLLTWAMLARTAAGNLNSRASSLCIMLRFRDLREGQWPHSMAPAQQVMTHGGKAA